MDKLKQIIKKNGKSLLNIVNKYKLLILIIICILLCVFNIFLQKETGKSAIMICESSVEYNKGIGLTFYIENDGKTIEKIEKNDTVSLEFIENNLEVENSEEILEEYKKNVKFIYENTMEKYKDVKWFDAELIEEDSFIKTIYTFDVSHRDFDYEKYKSLLEEFSLEYYYNIEEEKFIYDEMSFLSSNTPLGNIKNIICYDSTQKNDENTEKETVSNNAVALNLNLSVDKLVYGRLK